MYIDEGCCQYVEGVTASRLRELASSMLMEITASMLREVPANVLYLGSEQIYHGSRRGKNGGIV